uniref:Si:dkey-87o1.2 n=1 Tax=Gadus morhua TaxID=8049 RepID=A0A8C4Z8K7_GADMO
MKIVPVMAFLSVSVMVVMIYQAVRQELELRSLKARMLETSAELKQKEHAIIQEKNTIQDLNKLLDPLTKQKDQLNKNKLDLSRSVAQMTNSLVICNTDKEVAERNKADGTKALAEVNAEKNKAEEQIKILQLQILDRDKAICTFVDETKEEGRKLCSIAKAK